MRDISMDLLEVLARSGLMGVVAVIAVLALRQKDRDNAALYDRLVAMAENNTKMLHNAMMEFSRALDRLVQRIEELEEKELDHDTLVADRIEPPDPLVQRKERPRRAVQDQGKRYDDA